nr:hypothetical protein BaRGS_007855 [Batillaria attramentaria]
MDTDDFADNVYLVGLSLSSYLKTVYTDDYRLCCPDALPDDFHMENCHTQKNEIASCEDLLRSDVYRASLWIFATLALIGNTVSFVFRFCLQTKAAISPTSFDLFVTNLSVADFLMGVYLAVIGVADQVYRGSYLRYDEDWRTSPACKVAGFLSLVSSEVSAFNICLITVDRFLVLRFPFSRVRFRKWSAALACGITWLVGILLAAIPLLPITSHWEFYSQNGICIPLPITRHSFHGHDYSFGIMIVLNFVLFLFIVVGQVFIFWSVRANSAATTKSRNSRDATIARRLTTIVLSDFLCWFPIGLLGLLAATGTPISSEVNVGMAIFVLPFNSALNPFLYTLNIVWEKRVKASESRIKARLETKYASEISRAVSRSESNLQCLHPGKDSFFSYMDRCLLQQVVSPEDIATHLRLQQTTEFSGNCECTNVDEARLENENGFEPDGSRSEVGYFNL